jgi:hypothetical protein
MRQDVDRGVGEEFDVVGAALQRGFDVAGIQDIKEIQYALTMRFLGHSSTPPAFDPDLAAGPIVKGTAEGSISNRTYSM